MFVQIIYVSLTSIGVYSSVEVSSELTLSEMYSSYFVTTRFLIFCLESLFSVAFCLEVLKLVRMFQIVPEIELYEIQ